MAQRFERDRLAAGPIVQGFAAGGFLVDGRCYRGLLLTPDGVQEWNPPALGAIGPADLEPVLALSPLPEFLILGTGPTMGFASRALVQDLEEKGIGLEAM